MPLPFDRTLRYAGIPQAFKGHQMTPDEVADFLDRGQLRNQRLSSRARRALRALNVTSLKDLTKRVDHLRNIRGCGIHTHAEIECRLDDLRRAKDRRRQIRRRVTVINLANLLDDDRRSWLRGQKMKISPERAAELAKIGYVELS